MPTVSKSVLPAACISALCLVGALGFLVFGPWGVAGSANRFGQRERDLAVLLEGIQQRLDVLESQRQQRLVRAGAARDSSEPTDTADVDPEAESEEDALATQVTRLDSRVESLETVVRALEQDPISRGFDYVSSQNGDLRRRGIGTLRRIARSDPQALAAIRNLLADPEADVREEALEALEDVDDRESVPQILGMLGDPESDVRETAIESLAELLEDADAADPQVEAAAMSIAERLADPDEDTRRRAANALGDFNGHAAVPALLQALEDTDDEVREQAIDSLADLEAGAAVPRLRELYEKGNNPGDRMDLALALRRLGDVQPFQEEATRLSQLATGNVDEGERRQAIRQLGRFEADELRPVFEQALRDTDRRVRREAEEALEELDESRDRRGR